MPLRKTIGRNTTTVVTVAASTGIATSSAASMAAVRGALPMSRCRCVFSTTTMESSTSRPITSAKPPSVIRFSVCPVASSPSSAAMIDSGIASAAIQVARSERRKSSTASAASKAPKRPSFMSARMAWRTYTD